MPLLLFSFFISTLMSISLNAQEGLAQNINFPSNETKAREYLENLSFKEAITTLKEWTLLLDKKFYAPFEEAYSKNFDLLNSFLKENAISFKRQDGSNISLPRSLYDLPITLNDHSEAQDLEQFLVNDLNELLNQILPGFETRTTMVAIIDSYLEIFSSLEKGRIPSQKSKDVKEAAISSYFILDKLTHLFLSVQNPDELTIEQLDLVLEFTSSLLKKKRFLLNAYTVIKSINLDAFRRF